MPPNRPLFTTPANQLELERLFPCGLPPDYLEFAGVYGSGVFELPNRYELQVLNTYDPLYSKPYSELQAVFQRELLMRSDKSKVKEVIEESAIGDYVIGDFDWSSDSMEERDATSMHIPDVCFPAPGGLLPWGWEDGGAILYWITSGNPTEWSVACDVKLGLRESYDLNLTGFLGELFTGRITTSVWTSDCSNGRVQFWPRAER